MVLTAVAMSHSGRMLFVGTAAGTLRSMKFPLTVPGEWTEYQGHGAAILKVGSLRVRCGPVQAPRNTCSKWQRIQL